MLTFPYHPKIRDRMKKVPICIHHISKLDWGPSFETMFINQMGELFDSSLHAQMRRSLSTSTLLDYTAYKNKIDPSFRLLRSIQHICCDMQDFKHYCSGVESNSLGSVYLISAEALAIRINII